MLTGRVAVITGGGAGIGRGIAAGMAQFGAKVAIWGAGSADLRGHRGRPRRTRHRHRCAREAEQVDAALARTTAEPGPVSILVNNAGGSSPPLLDTAENGWDALYRANLRHVLLCTQRVARQLVADGRGGSVIR